MEFKYKVIQGKFDPTVELAELLSAKTIAFDTETTGLEFTDYAMVGASFATREMSWYIHGDEALRCLEQVFDQLFCSDERAVVGHNLKFDMHFIRGYYGREVTAPKIADTMVAMQLVDENRSKALKNMAKDLLGLDEDLPSFSEMLRIAKVAALGIFDKQLAEFQEQYPAYGTPLYSFYGDVTPPEMPSEFTIHDIPLDTLGRYGALDARLTYDCMARLATLLAEQEQYGIFMKFLMPLVRVLYEMEREGMPVDRNYLNRLNDSYEANEATLLTQWDKIVETYTDDTINPKSPPQIAEYLFDVREVKTAGLLENRDWNSATRSWESKGAPDTSVVNLNRIAIRSDQYPEIDVLLDYRKVSKALGTYVAPFLEREREGNVHGSFVLETVTGRLSSRDPNLMNIPSHGQYGHDIKKSIRSPEGMLFIGCDYGQLEMRILAHFAQCPILTKIFMENGDPHQITADMLSVPRQVAKTLNFGWAYGATHFSICNTYEKNIFAQFTPKEIREQGIETRPNKNEAIEWLHRFDEAYPALVEFRDASIRYAVRHGYVRTIAGRRRHIPDIKNSYLPVTELRRKREGRQCLNSIIQSSAADIMAMAMIRIQGRIKMLGASIIVQVHDELLVKAPEDRAQLVAKIVGDEMVGAGDFFKLRVPLTAQPSVGKSWAEVK